MRPKKKAFVPSSVGRVISAYANQVHRFISGIEPVQAGAAISAALRKLESNNFLHHFHACAVLALSALIVWLPILTAHFNRLDL